MPDDQTILRMGDLLFVRGTSAVSNAILACEQLPGESASEASHVGMIVADGSFRWAEVVEALDTVVRRTVGQGYGGTGECVLVARPLGVSFAGLMFATLEIEQHIGERYGYLKIAGMAADRVINGVLSWFARKPIDCRVFRGLYRAKDKSPICSVLVARAVKWGMLRTFGVPAECADPDQMLDYVRANPDQWEIVREWGTVPAYDVTLPTFTLPPVDTQ